MRWFSLSVICMFLDFCYLKKQTALYFSLFLYNRGQYIFSSNHTHTVQTRSLPLSCPEAFPRCPEGVRMCSISLCNQRQGGHLIPQHLLPLHRLTPVSHVTDRGRISHVSPAQWPWIYLAVWLDVISKLADRQAAGHLIRRPNKPRWSFSGDARPLCMLGCCHLCRLN